MGDREALKTFWDSYSDTPNVETMMLNKNAEEFDEQDRRDIWTSLPDLTGLRVVEIGSGIGRFTAALAKVAKHVLATDFVQSFIEKNEEINGHLGNVSFKCADAAHLALDSESYDFVFTNWLLMYLTDVEVVHFLESVLRWLTPNGYLNFRESCSESSKRTPTNPDDPSNPTHYRHICQYLSLLDRIRVRNETTGKLARFEVLWAKSVETYVRRPSHSVIPNWRQIHMLLRKVEVDESEEIDHQSPIDVVSTISIRDKERFEREMKTCEDLWGARSPLEVLILKTLQEHGSSTLVNTALSLFTNTSASVSPFAIAETLNCAVWDVNTNRWMYDYSLAQANTKGDKRLRFQYIPDIVRGGGGSSSWQYLPPEHQFDLAVGGSLMDGLGVEKLDETLANISKKIKPGGRIVLLERFDQNGDASLNALKTQWNGRGSFDTQDVSNSITSYLTAAITQLERAPELQELQRTYKSWLNVEHQTKWYILSMQVA